MRVLALTRRRPIFYGWWIVVIAMVAQFVSIGTQMFAAGVFLKPMTADLGWSRESFSAVQTLSSALGGIVGVFIGGMLDRRGPRPLMLAGGVVAGACVLSTAMVHSMWEYVLLRGVGQTLGVALCGGLVVNVTVSRWFVRRRGTAVALASLGISMGGVLMTPVLGWWVSAYGWRSGWVMLGVVVWVLILPSAMLIRRSPEDMGLLPDGTSKADAEAQQRAGVGALVRERQWTRPEAVRTTALWLVIAGYGLGTLGLGAFILHVIPFLTDEGFSRGKAAFLLSLFSWASLISKFVWGPMMDRIHARYLSALGFGTAGLALTVLPAATSSGSTALVIVVLAIYGFGMGGTAPLQETVWASYFGRMHLGKIRAVAMPFSIVFGSAGPLLGGALYDRTGDYTASFALFAATLWVGAVLVMLARPPRPPETAATVEPLPATAVGDAGPV